MSQVRINKQTDRGYLQRRGNISQVRINKQTGREYFHYKEDT